MAKTIKLTPELITKVREKFDKALEEARLSDGKFTFTASLVPEKAEAVIRFSEKAWLKQNALISTYDKEVAWHGLARRGEDESVNEYFIDDIIVYPQKVSGATVETDKDEYQTWLLSQGPEVMSKIRMQGHSHVNMSTTPSGTDTGYYKEILDQLFMDSFYIFMIWNKKGEKTCMVYDMKKNLLFENADCKVVVDDGEIGLQKLLSDAKEMVKDKVWSSSAYQWNRAQDTKPAASTAAPAAPATPAAPAAEAKKEPEKQEQKAPAVASSNPVRKGKRKTGKKSGFSGGYSSGYLYDSAYDDDPYGPFGWRDSWR